MANPEFDICVWTSTMSEKEARAAFRSRKRWVVPTSWSQARRYSIVIGNLSCRWPSANDSDIEFVRAAIQQGLEKSAYERLKEFMAISGEELSRVIRIPARTLSRRTVLKPDESERLLRVAATFQRAVEVLEDLGRARIWFSSPKRALGGRTPLEFCDSEPGAREVTHLLGRIEQGVFT